MYNVETKVKIILLINIALKIENAIGIPARILISAQAQYDLEATNVDKTDNQHETVSVTIPVRDHNLLREIVHRFGWACML